MDMEEGIEIENISLNSKKSIIKNDESINKKGIKNLYKFILLNRIFIILIIISFLTIGILSMFISINKKNSDFTEKDVLRVSTLIFSVLLIINGILWNIIAYFILFHILNVKMYKHYITIKHMSIVFLGSGSLFDNAIFDGVIYNNKVFTCLNITTHSKKNNYDYNNITDFLTLSYRSCIRSTPINIPIDFNCKKYNECVTINNEEYNIANYQNVSYLFYKELERDNLSWSGYMFLVENVNDRNDCSYVNKDICIVGGGFSNEMALDMPIFSWMNGNSGHTKNMAIEDFPKKYKFENSDLNIIYNNINDISLNNILNKLSNFNVASVLYDLLKKTEKIKTSNVYSAIIIHAASLSNASFGKLILIEMLSLYNYLTIYGYNDNKINVDSFSITFDVKYKYRFLIFSLSISCCVFILIIIYLLCIDNDSIIIKKYDKEDIIKLLLKINTKNLKNYDKNLKIIYKDKSDEYIIINQD